MGKQARLKKERKEARIKAGIARAPRDEKVGDLDDLIDDAEKLLKQMHNHVKSRIKLTVIQATEENYGTKEDQKHIRSGVSCGTCTAKKGCCTMSISALMFEGFPIARKLIKQGRHEVSLANQLHSVGDAMEKASVDGWFKTETPCVFLTEDQMCSIYDVRPSACRHHVVFGDPENCSGPADKPTLQFGSNDEVTTAFRWNESIAQSFFGFQDTSQTGVILMGALPKIVARALDCLDHTDYAKALREQDWPTVENPPNMS